MQESQPSVRQQLSSRSSGFLQHFGLAFHQRRLAYAKVGAVVRGNATENMQHTSTAARDSIP